MKTWIPRLEPLRRHPAAPWLGMVLIAVTLAVLPFVLASVGTAWVRITNLAILFALLALGLNIVVGFAGLLDLGYIAFYAVGAYCYALLASPHFGLHLPFWVILPIGAAMACVFGVLLGAPTLKLRGDYLAIVTLGFGEIVRIFLNNLSQPVNITNGPQGVTLIDPFRVAGVDFSRTETLFGLAFSGPIKYYYLLLVVLVVAIMINLRLQNSRIGRAWVAIREDEVAAQAMGINTRNIKLLAFAMGAGFGGVAGGIFAATQGFISPEPAQHMARMAIRCLWILIRSRIRRGPAAPRPFLTVADGFRVSSRSSASSTSKKPNFHTEFSSCPRLTRASSFVRWR